MLTCQFLTLVFVVVLSHNVKAQDQTEIFKNLVAMLCVDNLAADKAQIVAKCEATIPQTYRDVFAGCAKEALGVSQLTKAMLCYKMGPNGEKMTACLKNREEEAATHGIIIDEQIKQKFKTQYSECIVQVL